MKIRTTAVALASAAALAIVPTASAHVTLNPNAAPAQGFVELLVRVPNEQDKGATTKLDLKLPPGFASASYASTPGWSVKVKKTKLAKPIQTDDGPVTEQVSEITWTADSTKAGIQPGQFADFPLSVQVPGKEGDTLTFKAIQTYSDGTVVRWIGPPDADQPAPRVFVTAEQKEGAPPTAAATPAAATPASSSSSSSDDNSDTLAIIALIVGAAGLLLGGIALARARRTSERGA